ncbi:carbonic anhydrase 6 [Equus przewalskii]|uniref:Carbonic anhydrase n=1 Tax=Equus przewalskii TaxID=9798 RepID=A0ABM2F4M5_EQUPR
MQAPLTLLSLLLLGAQAGQHWTYSDGELDEAHWSNEYPTCGGDRQSPIDLQSKKMWYNPSLKPLTLVGYEDQEGEFSMTNNGHTVQISLRPTMHMEAADGTKYVAEQMHFHWGGGASEISGSEHTIDGIRYVTEIHLVHYNSKYGSYDIAKDEPDGLAVLAVLVEVSDYAENTYYSKFLSHLSEVRYSGQSTVLSGLNIQDMLPKDLRYYYSYQGSLTTPPCTENVQWFLLADPVKLSKSQVLKLENSLLDSQNKTLNNGYRSTQHLNGRVVETNFIYHPNQQSVLGSELQFHLTRIDNNLEYFRRLIEQKQVKRKGKY